LKPLSKSTKALLELAVSRYERLPHKASEYLLGRALSQDSIESFRLGFVSEPISGHEQYAGCIAIPSLGPSGVVGLRFRSLDTSGGAKYLGLSGAPTRLFNTRALLTDSDSICITEGEFDSIILNQLGYPSLGVSGSNNWKRHHPRMFAGFQRVYIFGDGDKAGTSFSKDVNESLSNGIRISLPTGFDVNSLYISQGEDAIHKLLEDD
jgi:DNA primase